jgi:hypothetical protein
MDWLRNVQKQAQEAAEKIISSDAASTARTLAQQATLQARTIAEQASVKARVRNPPATERSQSLLSLLTERFPSQEVAKEAIDEAGKSLNSLAVGQSKVSLQLLLVMLLSMLRTSQAHVIQDHKTI